MTVASHTGRQGCECGRAAAGIMPNVPNRTAERLGEVDWSQLDDFSLEDLFLPSCARVPKFPSFSEEPSARMFRFAVAREVPGEGGWRR